MFPPYFRQILFVLGYPDVIQQDFPRVLDQAQEQVSVHSNEVERFSVRMMVLAGCPDSVLLAQP